MDCRDARMLTLRFGSVLPMTQFALWHTNRENWLLQKEVVKTDFDMLSEFVLYTHAIISTKSCFFSESLLVNA